MKFGKYEFDMSVSKLWYKEEGLYTEKLGAGGWKVRQGDGFGIVRGAGWDIRFLRIHVLFDWSWVEPISAEEYMDEDRRHYLV